MPPPRRVLSLWLPVVLWLSVILSFSSGAASAQRTSRFLGPLITWLFPQWDEATRAAAHLLIRKAAHVAEYGILTALLLRALRGNSEEQVTRWRWRLALAAVTASALVACLDEFLQSRSTSRTGSPWDVALDSSGAALAVLLCWRLARGRGRRPCLPP